MAAAVLCQLGYAAYTGRQVAPAHFGAYATALALFHTSAVLTTVMVQLVLKKAELTERFLGSALLLAAGAGTLVCLVLQLLAPLAGLVWDAPELVAFLRVLLLYNLIAPVAAVCTAALRGASRFRTAALLEFTGQLAGFLCGAALLAAGLNPLGIATVSVASAVVPAAGGLLLLRPRVAFDARLLAEVRAMAGEFRLCARSAVTHSVMYGLPMWVAAAVLGAAATGHYSRAFYFASMVPTMLAQALTRIAVPAFARRTARGDAAFGEGLLVALTAASALVAVATGVLAALGPTALVLLLGAGWESAGALVPWCLAGLGLQVLCTLGHQADEARGDHAAVWANQKLIAAVIAAGCGAAALLASPHALVLAHAAGVLTGHAAQLRRWARAGLLLPRPRARADAAHG
ncbi:oligosaccharide flippase family protein, partial [Streptomyces sp. NPDC001941]|uniref:oligosaccharide flippase family protein n=1 Tax=Streptomyces sp. NPDC001941 TaxID=3154659 RepID=UPI0033276795